MVNLAIVVSVSQYDELISLPGCVNDALIINEILHESGKYDQILLLSGKVIAQEASEQISRFVAQHGLDLGEIFFYFSGHGSQQADDFFYAFSDYNESKRNSTGITQSDLDQIFRSASPKLLVKVIDACESGTKYIKTNSSEYISSAKTGLNDIYFIFSSSYNQSSYQTDRGSHFTVRFAEAVLDKAPGDIRYIDLINRLKDSFIENDDQKPYFISQANFTELFCNLSQLSRDKIGEMLNKIGFNYTQPSLAHSATDKDENEDFNTVLSEIDNIILQKEEYEEFLKNIETSLQNFPILKDIEDIYVVSFKKSKESPPGEEYLARWFSKNNSSNYFVDVHYAIKKFERRVAKQDLNSIAWAFNNEMKEYVYLSDERKVPTYYNITTGDISFISVEITSKYSYLNKFEFYVAFAPSLLSFVAFTSYADFKKINWNSDRIQLQSNWKSKVFDKTNHASVSEFIEECLKEFVSTLSNYLFSFRNN